MKKRILALVSTVFVSLTACRKVVDTGKLNERSNKTDEQHISEEKKEDIVITIPEVNDLLKPEIREYAEKFSEEDNGYKVIFKDYNEYYDHSVDFESLDFMLGKQYSKIDEKVCLDIVKGGVLDIIPANIFYNQGKFESLENKEVFADLYNFMENDETVNRDTLSEVVLTNNETNGKLCSLPLFYSIKTMMGYSKYVGTKENWTFDEMIEKMGKMPEDSTFNGDFTRDGVCRCILYGNIGSFIDIKNKTASFDSPEFIRILEFINSFPPPLGYKTDEGASKPRFVFPLEINTTENFHSCCWNEKNDDVTLVGYPTKDGNGAYIDTRYDKFAINAHSSPEVQKGAWEFIKHFAEYEYQYEKCEHRFPVNNKAFDDYAMKIVNNPYKEKFSIRDNEYERDSLTLEEYEHLCRYISNIKKQICSVDGELFEIIQDEILSMIYDEISPQEAAEIIQNRVSIFVSERY